MRAVPPASDVRRVDVSPEETQRHAALMDDYRRLKALSDVDAGAFKAFASLYPRRPSDSAVELMDADGVAAEWVATPGADASRAILYLHGGGYTEGSPRGHRELVARVARAAGASALAPDYRLAPDHPFPAALDDALRAYRWLSRRVTQIVVFGDSAGGGLAVALMAQLAEGDLAPRAAGLMSPWLDLTAAALTPGVDDPFVTEIDLRLRARLYAGAHDPADPRLSPLFGDLSRLPPTIVQAGAAEALLNDAVRFAASASSAGAAIELEIWESMSHVWHQWGARLPPAERATATLATRVAELAGWRPLSKGTTE